MNTDVPQQSARILQFPVGGRRALMADREQQKAVADRNTPRVSVGGAWYHDAAITDTKRSGER